MHTFIYFINIFENSKDFVAIYCLFKFVKKKNNFSNFAIFPPL
jgi:hypothetical protein